MGMALYRWASASVRYPFFSIWLNTRLRRSSEAFGCRLELYNEVAFSEPTSSTACGFGKCHFVVQFEPASKSFAGPSQPGVEPNGKERVPDRSRSPTVQSHSHPPEL